MLRFLILLLLTFPALAAEDNTPAADVLPEVPDRPPPVESGEEMEPDITITRKDKKTVQEYRRGGRLYMIKVIPDIGPPYYFIDDDGDGYLDARGNDLDKGSRVNMWKILEWD